MRGRPGEGSFPAGDKSASYERCCGFTHHLGRPLELKYRRRTTGLVVRPWQTAWRTQVVFRTLLPLSLFFKFVVLSLMTPLLIRPRLAP